MPLANGARLGPYEVIDPLGSGGMGEVYRARDTRLGREVAIKVLPSERMADEHRRARFAQEARAASALNHPHIVTIYDIASAEGTDFIVIYSVAPHGLFHVDCNPLGSRNASQHLLRYWDAATGQDRPVATFDADWTAGLSASPDGKSVIYGRSIFGWDLVMIENFR